MQPKLTATDAWATSGADGGGGDAAAADDADLDAELDAELNQ